ncbi:hypothetical protein BU14_2225s0002, partial [Porphyra umbilicalis]
MTTNRRSQSARRRRGHRVGRGGDPPHRWPRRPPSPRRPLGRRRSAAARRAAAPGGRPNPRTSAAPAPRPDVTRERRRRRRHAAGRAPNNGQGRPIRGGYGSNLGGGAATAAASGGAVDHARNPPPPRLPCVPRRRNVHRPSRPALPRAPPRRRRRIGTPTAGACVGWGRRGRGGTLLLRCPNRGRLVAVRRGFFFFSPNALGRVVSAPAPAIAAWALPRGASVAGDVRDPPPRPPSPFPTCLPPPLLGASSSVSLARVPPFHPPFDLGPCAAAPLR